MVPHRGDEQRTTKKVLLSYSANWHLKLSFAKISKRGLCCIPQPCSLFLAFLSVGQKEKRLTNNLRKSCWWLPRPNIKRETRKQENQASFECFDIHRILIKIFMTNYCPQEDMQPLIYKPLAVAEKYLNSI